MRIKVDVELHKREISNIAHVQEVFKMLSDNVETRLVTDKEGLTHLVSSTLAKGALRSIAQELTERLCHPALYEDCLSVLCGVIFDPERVERDESLSSVISFISQLPDNEQKRVKSDIVQRAMTYLSKPRRLDCSRNLLLPYAEVIAVLTKAEMLNVRSVVVALMQMIRLDTTRTAGITCLGKLVEVTRGMLLERLDQHMLQALRDTVVFARQDDILSYDVDYIMEAFGWEQSPKFVNFCVRHSGVHHKSAILTLAYSGGTGSREVVVTSSVDGTIGTWDHSGALTENLVLSRHYASSIDFADHGRALIVGTVGRTPSIPPAIVIYTTQPTYNDESNWQEKCGAEPREAMFITTVKCLRSFSSVRYCCGAAVAAGSTLILYDATQVVQEYSSHSDVISAMHVIPERENTVVTGSRDCSVMVYDLRAPQGVAVTSAHRHYSTVTSIGSCGEYLFTSGLDRRVVVNDLRMMGQGMLTQDLDSAVLSISVNSSMVCAASTLTGVHLINFASSPILTCKADGMKMSPRYNTITWNAQGDVLYAGGDNNTLDMFTRRFSENEPYAS